MKKLHQLALLATALLLALALWAPALAEDAIVIDEPIAIGQATPSRPKAAVAKAATTKGTTAKSLPRGITPRTDLPAATTPIIELDAAKGRLMIRYQADNDSVHKVQICFGSNKVPAYNFYAVNAPQYFPLQFGNGTYEVWVYKQNTTDDKYSPVLHQSVDVNLQNPTLAFLASHYNVNYDIAPGAVSEATLVTKTAKGGAPKDKTTAVYNALIKVIQYDYDKLGKLPGDYVPDMEVTLKTKKGVCYDTASLMAGMLRSAGVPTRLATGYTTEVKGYHAWVEVYLDGSWKTIDPSVDAQLYGYKKQYTMIRDPKKNSHQVTIFY